MINLSKSILYSCIALVCLVFIFNACKKNDFNQNNPHTTLKDFFALPTNTNPTVARVAAELKKQNDNKEFIDAFTKLYGYAIWDKAFTLIPAANSPVIPGSQSGLSTTISISGNGSTDTTVLVPLVEEGATYVSAFISAKINDTVVMRLYRNSDYLRYPYKTSTPSNYTTAEEFALRMMLFDNAVFGYTRFIINDKKLFNGIVPLPDTSKDIRVIDLGTGMIPAATNFAAQICVTHETTVTSHICNTPDHPNCIPTCDNCGFPLCYNYTQSHSETICVPTGGGGGGSNGWPTSPPPPPPTGGGGSGGGGGQPGGCPFAPELINSVVPPIGDCGSIPNPWPPIVLILKNTLNLNTSQTNWLAGHLNLANQLVNYLEISTTPTRIDIANEHLALLMNSSDYYSFASGYNNINGIMWWENTTWLKQIHYQMPEVVFNFYMKNTRPENKKPEEFADRCDGLKAMAERTKADHKERLGYITYDGKFIITDIGEHDKVKLNFRARGNSIYYAYPLSLGMPAQSYYGTIVDTAQQLILILVRASVHTHPDGYGVSIDFPNAKSQGDLESAYETSSRSPSFNNYVIEPYGNTFKTGRFDNDDNNKNYFDTHSGLSLEGICEFITN